MAQLCKLIIIFVCTVAYASLEGFGDSPTGAVAASPDLGPVQPQRDAGFFTQPFLLGQQEEIFERSGKMKNKVLEGFHFFM